MEDKPQEIGNLVGKVVAGLAFCADKSQEEMTNDLLTLTLARLKVDWLGSRVEHADENEELAAKEIQKITGHLNSQGWETVMVDDLFLGKFYEESVTRSGQYGIFDHGKSMGLVFAPQINNDIKKLLQVRTVEKRQQFAWIAPYFTPVRRVIFQKNNGRIEVLLPSK